MSDTPSRVSPSATAAPTKEHPEAICQRCGRENIESWHAPSPLWNAVMRNEETGDDLYSVVCPICFAEMAVTVIGPVVWCIKPHGKEVRGLWADADGRQWDPDQCLWVATLDTPRSPSEEAEVVYVNMEAFNNPANGKQGFVLSHGLRGVGFGEFVFVRHPDGRYTVDNETMGRPWVRRVLNAFLDKCELRDEV